MDLSDSLKYFFFSAMENLLFKSQFYYVNRIPIQQFVKFSWIFLIYFIFRSRWAIYFYIHEKSDSLISLLVQIALRNEHLLIISRVFEIWMDLWDTLYFLHNVTNNLKIGLLHSFPKMYPNSITVRLWAKYKSTVTQMQFLSKMSLTDVENE